MELEFYEKEARVVLDHPYYGTCLMHPVVMKREGIEYTILERREPQPPQADDLVKRIIARLKENDGAYAMYFGDEEDVLSLISSAIHQKTWFKASKQILQVDKKQGILKFTGSLHGSSIVFLYYIFDFDLAKAVIQSVKAIQDGEFEQAQKILNAYQK